ncbi:MBL fold metallo-hydrolase [Streptosporangiaceae bacterium NEAU-GS5]|nr:MBL fold metallo-hydrolase [Streptosporangiaceae bacterium NEAU-GS5]
MNHQMTALSRAAQWPDPDPRTLLVLAFQFLAARRHADAHAFFAALPDSPRTQALTGFFLALDGDRKAGLALLDQAAERELGVPHYLRGRLTGRADDLEFVVAVGDQFPPGFVRSARSILAGEPGPHLVTDWWRTEADGPRFAAPHLDEVAPGIYQAMGYDFADFTFVVTEDGIVAIDASGDPAHFAAALADLPVERPVTHVILTHGHWDHVGGLPEGVEVIAHANLPEELERLRGQRMPWPYFRTGTPAAEPVPDLLVADRQTVAIGGVDFELIPSPGGETTDGLLVKIGDLLFAGDMIMPYLGAPFFAEGSPDGLLDALALVNELAPERILHGHSGLTMAYTIDVLPALETALRSLRDDVRGAIADGLGLPEILGRDHLPESLRRTPTAVLPYLVIREGFIRRLHLQNSGYWQPDATQLDVVSADEWAGALDLLAGGKPDAFRGAVTTLLDQGEHALALRVADAGARRHPCDQDLADLRRDALLRLVEQHQVLDPFKFIVYSGLAGLTVNS